MGNAASPHFFVGLRALSVPFADVKASLTHLLYAQAMPMRETAPERELLPVSKGSAFGRPEGVPRGRGQIVKSSATPKQI